MADRVRHKKGPSPFQRGTRHCLPSSDWPPVVGPLYPVASCSCFAQRDVCSGGHQSCCSGPLDQPCHVDYFTCGASLTALHFSCSFWKTRRSTALDHVIRSDTIVSSRRISGEAFVAESRLFCFAMQFYATASLSRHSPCWMLLISLRWLLSLIRTLQNVQSLSALLNYIVTDDL